MEALPNLLKALLTQFQEQNAFTVSLIFGALVILVHSRKKLGEFADLPRGDEFDFVKLLTLASIVGNRAFYKAYFYYVALLEILYLGLCASKEVAVALAQLPPGSKAFDGAAWPLGASLLVVGFLPSVPILAQIEQSLRNMAHTAANIPGIFFDRVTALSQGEIEHLVENAPTYTQDLLRLWDLQHLLICLRIPEDDAQLIARRAGGAELFNRFTIEGDRIWSADEYDRYKEILALLGPKSQALLNEVDALRLETANSPIVIHLRQLAPVTDHAITPFDANRLLQSASQIAQKSLNQQHPDFTDAERAQWSALNLRWQQKATELHMLNRRLIALFAILATNDQKVARAYQQAENMRDPILGRPRNLDPVLQRLFKLIDPRAYIPNPWYNASLLSNLAAFAACFIALFAYLFCINMTFYEPAEQSNISDMLKNSLSTSVYLFVSFMAASFTALFMRNVRKRENKWTPFTDLSVFPLMQYGPIIASSILAAFVPLFLGYILYYAPGSTNVAEQPPTELAGTIVFQMLWTLVPVTFAVGLCVLTDIADRQNREQLDQSRLPIVTSGIIAFIAFLLLVARYSVDTPIFWHNIASCWFFAISGLFVFRASMRAYRRDLPPPPVGNPAGPAIAY